MAIYSTRLYVYIKRNLLLLQQQIMSTLINDSRDELHLISIGSNIPIKLGFKNIHIAVYPLCATHRGVDVLYYLLSVHWLSLVETVACWPTSTPNTFNSISMWCYLLSLLYLL